MSSPLADLLGKYLQRTHTSVNRLAILSGIPQRTVANWLNGYIRKPHQWQSVVKVALALHLTESETNALLQSAGYPSLPELHTKPLTPSDLATLSGFQPSGVNLLSPPFQVIADIPTFVGRFGEIEELKHALLGGRVTVFGIRGMGCVGKTALAAHMAYQLRDQFPDGVLWARLDTSDSLSILGAFADAYDKDVSHYKDAESRASVVRNILAGKRALIVLDNAETSAQVRVLLPPSTGTCAVLITTRHDLSILDGWRHITLEPFDSASNDVIQLFERYLGSDFVRLHHILLLEIAALLGYLPLALAIAAGQLANETLHSLEDQNHETQVTALLDSLRTSAARLNTLTRGDMGVRASFEASYITLTPFQQDLFSTLGIFDGDDFGSDAVAYLTDQTLGKADTELGHLLSLSLVQKSRAARWRLHPLLQDYAREKLETTGRLIQVVEKTLLMYRQAVQGQWTFEGSLDAEIPNIRFALDQADRLNLYRPLLETVRVMYPILYIGAWYSLARTLLMQARVAAHILGDLDAELYFIKGLANMQMGLGDNKNGRENLQLALQLTRSGNREEDIADILWTLGKLEHDTGYRREASIYFEESLVLARKINNAFMVGRNLNSLATGLMAGARYREAEKMFLEALEISRAQKKAEEPVHRALINLGELYWHLEDWERADIYWREALSLARAGKYRAATVLILSNVANIHAIRGEWMESGQRFDEAIQLAVEIHSPRVEGIARSEYGNVLRKQTRFDEALEQLNRAKGLVDEAGDLERKGFTLLYLGSLYLDRGQLEEAQVVLEEASAIVKEIYHEILIADICFVQAKVSFAIEKYAETKRLARNGLRIYERLGLSRQSEELRNWMRTQAKISPASGGREIQKAPLNFQGRLPGNLYYGSGM